MSTSSSIEDPMRGENDALSPFPAHLVQGALVVVAAAAVIAWLFLALSHLHDRYGVLHVQGAWIGLAQYANDGVLYPPLFDGEHYGGTRWMPMPILLNAAAARVTGEYLVSGKLVALVLMAGLLMVTFATLRWMRSPRALSAAFVGTIVATEPGRIAGATLGGDVLPVVLQLGALVVAATGRMKRAMPVAGILAGLALASKTTGVWAFLAIVTWCCLHKRWRDLVVFMGAFSVTVIVILGGVEIWSEGRFSDNMELLTFAGVGLDVGPIRAPNQVLYQLANFAVAVWVLVPFAALGLFMAYRARRTSVFHLAFIWAFLLVLVTYTDVGTGFNQLLDVTVLTVLVVGELAGRLDRSRAMTSISAVLALALIWGTTTGTALTLIPDVRRTVEGTSLGYPIDPLAGRVAPTDEILSEDPYVSLSLGRLPVVLDPFMLRRIDQADPALVDPLIERIDRRNFDYIVTIEPLGEERASEPPSSTGGEWTIDEWWAQYHFGLRVVDAMRRSYVLDGIDDGYYVYRPRT